ncbi:hypothetical protein CSKR_100442, partial [Clonorchis sinensis]
MPPEASTRAGILRGCPSLDRGSREAEVWWNLEPRTFRVGVGTLNFVSDLWAQHIRWLGDIISERFSWVPDEICSTKEMRWPKWLEREFTDRKVRGSYPTSASPLLLSRLGQPGSIRALVLPLGGMVARHRKGVTAER